MLISMTDTAGGVCLCHTLAMQTGDPKNKADSENSKHERSVDDTAPKDGKGSKEVGGRGGLDPTRYGDWEKAGRCIDF